MKISILAIFALTLAGAQLAEASLSVSGGTYTPVSIGGVYAYCQASALQNGTILQVADSTAGNVGYGSDCYGLGIDQGFSTTQALSGSFTLGLDTVIGDCPAPAPGQPGCFPYGQSIYAIVVQPAFPSLGLNIQYDVFYYEYLGYAPTYYSLTPLSFSGVFDPLKFTDFSIYGPAHPDLSGGTQTEFGFAGANINTPTVWQDYSDFTLTSGTAPEPSSYGLLVLGLGGLASIRRLTKKRG